MESTRRLMLVRALALAFIIFLIAVAVIANRGEGDVWWPLLSRIPAGDKLGHIGLFATLSLLCNLAFPKCSRSAIPILTTATFVLLLLLTLDEISQHFIPNRSFDPLDWLANGLGLLIGQTAATAFLKFKNPVQ
ncbi:MAG: VanZ family protein [Akkermansiaceae bacterium]|jgi:VanZ family protein|nr:VanZ family protein [Akkermansiaceae bacterium]